MPCAARRIAVEELQHCFAYLDRCLRQNPYLMGRRFTVADAYCFTILSWAHFHRIDLSAHAAINTFMGRISDRPMVRKALQAEGLLKAA